MSEEQSSTKKNRASIKSIAQYNKTNYDRIAVVVPKGSAEAIKAAAAAENKSTNRYILEAIEAKSGLRLAMDSTRSFAAAARGYTQIVPQKPSGATTEAPQGVGAILTPETLKTAAEAAEKAEETVSEFIGRAVETQADRDRRKRALTAPTPHVPSILDKI